MKKLLPLLLVLMSGTSAHASMSTRHQTSLQLSVDAARTITSRTANSYSVSGSGVTLDVGGGGSADNSSGGFKTISNGSVTEWNIPTATTTANVRLVSQIHSLLVMLVMPLELIQLHTLLVLQELLLQDTYN